MNSPQALPTLGDIEQAARVVLALAPQPAARYRLLRDVLRQRQGDPALQAARRAQDETAVVRQLAAAQLADGSWGRFHTRDTTLKQRIVTSEAAIECALAVGLDACHPVLVGAVAYMQGHLRGEVTWRDRVEGHDDPRLWPFFIRFISAGRLAQVMPDDPLLADCKDFMRRLLDGAFTSGEHDLDAEKAAQRRLSGIPTRSHWALLSNLYGVLLLGAAGDFSPDLERAWLQYLLTRRGGIYYVSPDHTCLADRPTLQDLHLPGWLRAHELLAAFPAWRELAANDMAWLWAQRGPDGLWDVGPRAGRLAFGPLSDNWRRRENRIADGSVRILALLRRWVAA